MSALDKIARHLGFYGLKPEAGSMKREAFSEREEESPKSESPEVRKKEDVAAVVDRNNNNLPMDYPVEDFELEGIELKTVIALEGVDVSPGRLFEPEESGSCSGSGQEVLECGENMENILTISPLVKKYQVASIEYQDLNISREREPALRMGADTGPVAKACVV